MHEEINDILKRLGRRYSSYDDYWMRNALLYNADYAPIYSQLSVRDVFPPYSQMFPTPRPKKPKTQEKKTMEVLKATFTDVRKAIQETADVCEQFERFINVLCKDNDIFADAMTGDRSFGRNTFLQVIADAIIYPEATLLNHNFSVLMQENILTVCLKTTNNARMNKVVEFEFVRAFTDKINVTIFKPSEKQIWAKETINE